jgi:hypothetical protein
LGGEYQEPLSITLQNGITCTYTDKRTPDN